ncbi:MAG: histidine kinase [Arenimonas sp.]|nr:histidine kinase [Arenimonas sp.]
MASSPAPPSPLEALWQPQALIAVVLAGEGLAALLALAPGNQSDRWVHFGLASIMIQWVGLLTLAGLYFMRRPLARLAPPRVAWIALSLLLISTWLAGAASWWMLQGPDPARNQDWPTYLLQLSAMALTVGVLGLAAFQNFWRARRMALLAKQSELEALQARIRPHFLFNTLNTGAALVHDQPGQAERLLLDLADLFRAALSGPRDIPLADELALARRYLEIESLRFGDRLRLGWDLPDPLPGVLMPALSIQPLVENAIRHGVEPSAGGARVDVAVKVDGDAVWVVISNDLPPRGAAAAPGHHVGLASARERIEALSQGRGKLDTEIRDGRFIATIRMPLG